MATTPPRCARSATNVIINMSVWRDVGALGLRLQVRARRDHAPPARMVLPHGRGATWCCGGCPQDTSRRWPKPSRRLEHLREHGPTAEAFTFGEAFSAPDAAASGHADFVQGQLPRVKPRFFATPEKFRAWLANNHSRRRTAGGIPQDGHWQAEHRLAAIRGRGAVFRVD